MHPAIDEVGLERLLARANAARDGGAGAVDGPGLEAAVELLFAPSRRLIVYGSLAPGESNHAVVADLEGEWCRCAVRGRLLPSGWGAGLGYPGIRLGGSAPVGAWLLVSPQLAADWPRLDAFEGSDYRRQLVIARDAAAADRILGVANIYEARAEA